MPRSQYLIMLSVACAFCLWGAVGVLTDALLPDIRNTFSLSATQAGLLIGVWSGSFVVGSWLSARCAQIFRLNTIFVVASSVTFVAFAALFVMPSILLFSPAFVLIGVMMGVSVTIGHSLIGEGFPERRTAMLSVLDVLFTLGALALSLGGFEWRTYYLVLSGVFALLAVGLAIFLPRMPLTKKSQEEAKAETSGFLKDPYLVLLRMTGLFLGTVEWAQNSWIVSFALAENETYVTAQLAFAIYFSGMLVARILTVFIAERLQIGRASLHLLSLALLGNVILIYGPGIWSMIAGNFLIGFGIGAIFPIALGRAMDFAPRKAAVASATLLMGVIAGSQIAAVFLGWLADQLGGVGMAFKMTTPFFILLLISFALFTRKTAR